METKRIVITGASDGIGAAAARQLRDMGHQVVIVGRSPEKTGRVAGELNAPCHIADFSRLREVRRLAEELKSYDRIDVLANNAGGLMKSRQMTEDGFELTFQVNLLAGFLLTTLLKEKLSASHATVIQTSSIASNLFGKGFDVHDLNSEKSYTPTGAYGNAKLENLLLAREMNRRWSPEGIHAVAFEPGITRTNFAAESGLFFRLGYHTPLKYLFTISPEKSAARLTRLAAGTPGRDFEPGMAYSERSRFTVWCEKDIHILAAQLWEQLEEMISHLQEEDG